MKKKILALCAITLTLTGCGKIPKLSNGDEAIVTFENGHMISANELYENMKNNYALASLINLVDNYIYDNEFKDFKDDAQAYAESVVANYKEQMSESDFLLMLNQNGYSSIEAFQNYVYTSRMQSHLIEEYAKKQLTDEEIEKYYKDVFKGDVEISHILITPEVNDDMTDDEIKEAENKAKEKAQEVIDTLKKAENVEETFKELVKEYSQDEATKSKDGYLGIITYGDLSSEYDELLDHAYRLKDGGFSTDVITTELGYHVIYKTKSYDKDPLEDVKDDIIDTLKTDYINEHSDIYVLAPQEYRKNYGMDIQDDTVKKQYTTYMENLLQSYRQAQESQN